MLVFSVLYFCTRGGPQGSSQVLCEGPKEWAPGSSAALINVTGDSARPVPDTEARMGYPDTQQLWPPPSFWSHLEPPGEHANSGRLGGRLFL